MLANPTGATITVRIVIPQLAAHCIAAPLFRMRREFTSLPYSHGTQRKLDTLVRQRRCHHSSDRYVPESEEELDQEDERRSCPSCRLLRCWMSGPIANTGSKPAHERGYGPGAKHDYLATAHAIDDLWDTVSTFSPS